MYWLPSNNKHTGHRAGTSEQIDVLQIATVITVDINTAKQVITTDVKTFM